MSFELARKVADAVLYEGYVLYPYRASSSKNRVRWQFGVVVPRGYSEREGSEFWTMQTECLVEAGADTVLDTRVRFLQIQARSVEEIVPGSGDGGVRFREVDTLEVGDTQYIPWDEGVEREVDAPSLDLATLSGHETTFPIDIPEGRDIETLHHANGDVAGRLVRDRWAISGRMRIAVEPVGTFLKVRIRIENTSDWPDAAPLDRNLALRRSLIGAHTLLSLSKGGFVSLLEPPAHAKEAVSTCRNERTWPVLIGPEGGREVVLSSPIILYDYPAIAPESPGDLCDSAEIDEILTLRIMTLTEEEKREARATDERARRIIERSDSIPQEMFEKMHGAMRWANPSGPAGLSSEATLNAAPEVPSDFPSEVPSDFYTPSTAPPLSDWETFLNPEGQAHPVDDSLQVGSERLSEGSLVRLHPVRRADSIDFFLKGRTARVKGIFRDVDGEAYVGVTLADDPSGDLLGSFGRFFFFYPEEIEPLGVEANREPVSERRD